MLKLKFFLDFEKEEKWLNQMAKAGWELTGKHFGYTFRKAVPNDAIIKIDYRSFKRKEDFEDYRMLFQDSGWEHVVGTKSSGTQYFRKTKRDGDDDIFSDTPSKAARYKRLSNMWLSMAVSFIPIFTALISTKTIDIAEMMHPKQLYYTPGLWEKAGIHFWGAFLFETPFALMRGFIWVLFPVLIFLYAIFAMKSEKNYRKTSRT